MGFILGKEKAFYGFSQFLSLFPGITGEYLRYGFYSYAMKKLGNGVCICFGSLFSHPEVEIGNGVYIGPGCNIGLCIIENDVLIGTGVHIMSGSKQHLFDNPDIVIREQERNLVKIKIGEDSWLGNMAVIAANVGKKSVIGTNSTVLKDIPSFSVAAGNPARVIKHREKQL